MIHILGLLLALIALLALAGTARRCLHLQIWTDSGH